MNALPAPSDFNTAVEPAADFDVVVLGAGVVGVNTAYWALRHGKSVCVIDRQPAAGLETSFANGGQISVSHAEPWANPSAPLKVMKWRDILDGLESATDRCEDVANILEGVVLEYA